LVELLLCRFVVLELALSHNDRHLNHSVFRQSRIALDDPWIVGGEYPLVDKHRIQPLDP
jgi:hypothetical protein